MNFFEIPLSDEQEHSNKCPTCKRAFRKKKARRRESHTGNKPLSVNQKVLVNTEEPR